jgi:hypothetical protein
MRLTWRDAVATVFTAAIVVIYLAFLHSTTAWLISSARGTATAVLVLGFVGGCGMGAAAQYRDWQARAYMDAASMLGPLALAGGVVALITASKVALAVLVAAAVALWLVATLRHALAGPASGGGHGEHEAIHPEKTAH